MWRCDTVCLFFLLIISLRKSTLIVFLLVRECVRECVVCMCLIYIVAQCANFIDRIRFFVCNTSSTLVLYMSVATNNIFNVLLGNTCCSF